MTPTMTEAQIMAFPRGSYVLVTRKDGSKLEGEYLYPWDGPALYMAIKTPSGEQVSVCPEIGDVVTVRED